ncbi:MAG: NfeD family protein, partial [Halanaerobiales bacterium]
MPLWTLWVIVGIILLIIEVITPNFIIGSFALGCFGAGITAAFTPDMTLQVIVFTGTTLLFLLLVRPVFLKYLDEETARTNVNSLAGNKAKVLMKVGPGEERGRVKVGGEDWMAVSEDGSVFEEDEIVEVVRVDGAKVIVK